MEPDKTSNPNSEGICVAIRMRPLNDRELSGGQEAVFKCITDHNAIAQLKDHQVIDGQTYYYDKVFDDKATTANVYTYVAKEIVSNVASGINGTIFACKSSHAFQYLMIESLLIDNFN